MYRPLVQPKFYHSRGQQLGPGYGVLVTGGSKQFGRSVVSNPELLNDAESWTVFCANTVVGDGFVRTTDYGPGDCELLRQDVPAFTNNSRYRVEAVVPELVPTGPGYIQISLGNVPVLQIYTPGKHVWQGVLTGSISGRVIALINNPVSLSTLVTYLNVFELNP